MIIMGTKLKTTTLLGLIALAVAQSARADLIVNGNFASTSNGNGQLGYNTDATGWSVPSGGYTFLFTPGTADTTGANGQFGNLQLWGSNNGGVNTLTPPPTGGNIVAGDGAFQVQPIQQTINGLTPGQKYDVTFYFAGAQQYTFTSPTTEAWSVSLGGGPAVMTPILNNVNHGFTGWEKETVSLTADSSSDVLSFLAYGTPSGVPPFSLLSGVSMVAAPEPSALVGGGFVVLAFGLGSMRMFRKQKPA
jgi:hypothetical protein